MGGMLHLQAPGGIPIGMTLPLHATITEQWRNGVLKRVTPEGGPWEGDEFDFSGVDDGEGRAVTDAPADDDPWNSPPRPADSAAKAAWAQFAVALGAATAEEAAGMTRPALIKLCTPPEADPLAEG